MLSNLSVIIPNYNHSQHLKECFKRLKLQTQLPEEIIIIDDGSKDDSIIIIEEEVKNFKKKYPNISIKFFKNKINKGVIYTENLGVKKSSKDYIYFLSVDDTIEKTFLETSLKALSDYPQAGLSSCVVKVQSSNDSFVNNPINLPSNKIKYINPELCRNIFLLNDYWTGGNSCIYKKSIFIELGGLKEEFLGFCDIYLAMSVVAKYGAVFIPIQLTTFHIYETSYSSGYYNLEKIDELHLIYKKMINYFSKYHSDCFHPKLLEVLEERNIYKLKFIKYKQLIDREYELLNSNDLKINQLFIKSYRLLNYLIFSFIIFYIFIFNKKHIKNMIIDMFKIKIKQNFSPKYSFFN